MNKDRLSLTEHGHQFPLRSIFSDVGPIVMGCMGLGGDLNNGDINAGLMKQANQLVDTALDHGINYFDHADIYTLGRAERVFGEVLRARPELRSCMFLQSKCGIRLADENAVGRYDFSEQWLTESVNGILRRLNTDYLDCLLLHRPDCLLEADSVASVFARLQSDGKVRQFGVSNMHQQQMQLLQSRLTAPLVVNQLEISLSKLDWLNQGVDVNASSTNFPAGMLEYCQLNNVQLQAWGCLSQGRFSGADISNAGSQVKQTAALVAELANGFAVSPEAIVLAWLMRHPVGLQPVIGSTNPQRIAACAQARDVHLDRDTWYQLYVAARGVALP